MTEAYDCARTIDQRRRAKGMTIKALANMSGVNEDALYRTLNNQRKMTASELISTAITLGLELDDFKRDNATA